MRRKLFVLRARNFLNLKKHKDKRHDLISQKQNIILRRKIIHNFCESAKRKKRIFIKSHKSKIFKFIANLCI